MQILESDSMRTVVTVTTDFGLDDAYVASMKGVILSINNGAQIIDICHNVEPQNIAQGAFVFGGSYRYFPQGTVHIVVVDPGVGGIRKPILMKANNTFFVAPNNGVLSNVLWPNVPLNYDTTPQEIILPGEIEVVEITSSCYWLSPVSPIFHGRDIFAPVAAHLSLGVPPCDLGVPMESILSFLPLAPHNYANEVLVGHVVHIDHFGNMITDIIDSELVNDNVSVEIAGRCIEGLSCSYEAGSDLLAIIGSDGRLEIAAKNSNAARMLNGKIGDEVRVRR